MAEVNEDVINDVTDVTDDNITTDLDDETTKALKHFGIDPDNATTDDLVKVATRWYKAEQKAISEKREKKEAPKSEPTTKYLTEADLERRDFLKANPELNDYTKELTDFQKKGLSLDEAKVLILNSDKARQNREKLNSLGLSDWETNKEMTTITKAQLTKIAESNQSEYNRIRDLMDKGKITIR